MKCDIIGMKGTILSVVAATAAAFAALVVEAREVSGLDIDVDAGIATATFMAGDPGETNAVYYVWSNDGVDKGENIAAWPNVYRVGRVGELAGDFAITLPTAAAVTAMYAARVFLADSSVEYDYFVDAVRTGNTSGGYVNTGIYPNKTTAAVVDARWRSAAKNTTIFGTAHATANNNGFAFNVYMNSSASYFSSACQDKVGDWISSGLACDTVRHVFHLDAATGKLLIYTNGKLVDDSTQHDTSKITKTTSSYPIYLFCRQHFGSTADQKTNGEIYSCIISNNNACVRNYRPCVYNGEAGMYDFVVGKFFGSAISTKLIAEGTNTTYFVAEGDVAVAVSPAWTQATTDYVTDTPYVETLSIVSSSGGSKGGAAPLVLTGANNWGGSFTNNEGALVADFGQGLAAADELVLNGGTYGILTGDVFNWLSGGGPGMVSPADGVSSFGFSTYTHPFAVVADGDADAPIEYGTASATGFNPATFVLNDGYATDTLTLRNGIVGRNLDETKPTLTIQTGAATAVVERAMANLNLNKTGVGALLLKGTNTFGTVNVSGGGTLLAMAGGGTNTSGTVSVRGSKSVLRLRDGAWIASGALNLNEVVNSTTPQVVVDNAVLSVSSATIGAHQGAVGSVIVTNNAVLKVSESNDFTMRRGSLSQYGGTVSFYSLKMGTGYTYSVNYDVYGGKLKCRMTGDGGFYLGIASSSAAPSATMRVYDGAEVEVHSSDPTLGRYAGTSGGSYNRGYLYIYGGSFSVVRTGLSRAVFYVGYNGSGGMLVTNGLFRVDGGVMALQGSGAGRSAKIQILKDGVAKVDYIRKNPLEGDTRSSVLELDGGKIVAQRANNNFISGFSNASVGVGGFEIDTASLALSAEQDFAARSGQTWTEGTTADELLSEAAFTVSGGGRLALSGTNEWLCATCVSNATLAVGKNALPDGTLRLDGGVIDLGGFTHTVTNLVGAGIVSNGTLVVAGTTYPGWADGKNLVIAANATLATTNIAYVVKAETGSCGCIDAEGAINLDGAAIRVDGVELIGRRGVRLVRGAPIVGSPVSAAGQSLPLSVSRRSVSIGLPGTMLIVW